MRYGVVVAVAAGMLFAGCGHKDEPKDLVARVGERAINERELTRSFALDPKWKRGETEFEAHLKQLDGLMIQKIYAQEAERLGLDRDTLMQGYLAFIKQKEMIKGLYQRQVTEKVVLDEAEARRLYAWTKKSVDFEYVVSEDSARCGTYARQLAAHGAARLVLPADSSVRAGKREDVRVGSVAPELEPAIFTAALHEVKGPVRVGDMFMALRITGGTQEKFLTEQEFAEQREKINKIVIDRQADRLAARYVYEVMKDTDLRLNGPVFWAVANHFFNRVREEHLDPMKIQSINLTSDEIRLLQDDLRGMGDETVSTHKEGKLTVRELMEALANMPGSLRPRVRTPQNLKAAIGMIVRNQYLLREAERQNLGNDPGVLFEYGLQRDETLASAYYGRRRGEIQVTPEEVEAFKKRSPVSEEQVLFKFNMAALARDAKADSMLQAGLAEMKARYEIRIDTARVRLMLKTPDAVLPGNPVKIFVREVFM